MSQKQSVRKLRRRHDKEMTDFILKMLVRRFYNDNRGMAEYLLDSISKVRSIDDVYADLVVWSAKQYSEPASTT